MLAAPQTYVIDSTHTFPSFSYSHFGMSIQMSRFDKTTGTVTLDIGETSCRRNKDFGITRIYPQSAESLSRHRQECNPYDLPRLLYR